MHHSQRQHCISKGQSIKHHQSPPSLPSTYWVRLHINSVSSSPLCVKSLNSALIAGTNSSVLCKQRRPLLRSLLRIPNLIIEKETLAVLAAKYLQKISWELCSLPALAQRLSPGLDARVVTDVSEEQQLQARRGPRPCRCLASTHRAFWRLTKACWQFEQIP